MTFLKSARFWIASALIPLLFLGIIKARNLASERVHSWPVTVTGSPVYGVEIHAGEVVGNGSPEEKRLDAAAPFLLCKALRQYPMSEFPFGTFSVKWSTNLDAIAMSGYAVEMKYDRIAKTLNSGAYGVGGGHGTIYFNVTDDKLFQIMDAAGYFGKADLENLRKDGCTIKTY